MIGLICAEASSPTRSQTVPDRPPPPRARPRAAPRDAAPQAARPPRRCARRRRRALRCGHTRLNVWSSGVIGGGGVGSRPCARTLCGGARRGALRGVARLDGITGAHRHAERLPVVQLGALLRGRGVATGAERGVESCLVEPRRLLPSGSSALEHPYSHGGDLHARRRCPYLGFGVAVGARIGMRVLGVRLRFS